MSSIFSYIITLSALQKQNFIYLFTFLVLSEVSINYYIYKLLFLKSGCTGLIVMVVASNNNTGMSVCSITFKTCVSVWQEDSATSASSKLRCSSLTLAANVAEKGVNAWRGALVSSAVERNCRDPSRRADSTCREPART